MADGSPSRKPQNIQVMPLHFARLHVLSRGNKLDTSILLVYTICVDLCCCQASHLLHAWLVAFEHLKRTQHTFVVPLLSRVSGNAGWSHQVATLSFLAHVYMSMYMRSMTHLPLWLKIIC